MSIRCAVNTDQKSLFIVNRQDKTNAHAEPRPQRKQAATWQTALSARVNGE